MMCPTTCYALSVACFLLFTCTLHAGPLVVWINCRVRDDRLDHFYFSASHTAPSTVVPHTAERGRGDNRVVVLADDASASPAFLTTAATAC